MQNRKDYDLGKEKKEKSALALSWLFIRAWVNEDWGYSQVIYFLKGLRVSQVQTCENYHVRADFVSSNA